MPEAEAHGLEVTLSLRVEAVLGQPGEQLGVQRRGADQLGQVVARGAPELGQLGRGIVFQQGARLRDRAAPRQTSECSAAQAASSERRRRPVFSRMRARWFCTVRGEM